jgi:uncharacterized protein YndB with AHSA1/START domain
VKTIHHVVDVDAPGATIWSAITEARVLAGWWSTQVRSAGAAVGDRIEFTFAGDFNPVMQIEKVDAGTELVWRCLGGHDPWNDGAFRFQLVPLADGRTRVRFWQEYAIELSDDAYGTYNFNWGYYLESLRLLCTTGAGKPFEPGRQE